MSNRARQIYNPEFRFGLGGVSHGNAFNKDTGKDGEATLDAAWAVGIRYFDVARGYGFGLSERRFGHFLHNRKREDYLLSSKVGKLFKALKNQDSDGRDRKARQTQGSRRPVRRRSSVPAADVAVALVVGARSGTDLEAYNSLMVKVPSDLWTELKQQGVIEPGASIPASPEL
jgi:hypothetical protein